MVFSCCVPNCFVGYKRRKNPNATADNRSSSASVFRFPSDKTMRERWIRAIPRLNFNPCDNHRVCSEHFSSYDFITSSGDTNSTRNKNSSCLKRLRLKPSAVPHIFPNCPSYLSSVSTPRRNKSSSTSRLQKQNERIEQ